MADRSRRRGAAQAADAGRSRTDAPRHSQSGSVISPAAVAPRMIARPAACPPNAEVTSRDCEVVQMPLQHLFHPDAGFRGGVVHFLAQLYLDGQHLGSHTLLDRLAPDDEVAPFATACLARASRASSVAIRLALDNRKRVRMEF